MFLFEKVTKLNLNLFDLQNEHVISVFTEAHKKTY